MNREILGQNTSKIKSLGLFSEGWRGNCPRSSSAVGVHVFKALDRAWTGCVDLDSYQQLDF